MKIIVRVNALNYRAELNESQVQELARRGLISRLVDAHATDRINRKNGRTANAVSRVMEQYKLEESK